MDGCLLAIVHWPLAIGYCLLSIGYWLLVIGYSLLASVSVFAVKQVQRRLILPAERLTMPRREVPTRVRLWMDVYWLWLLAIGYWLLAIGYCLLSSCCGWSIDWRWSIPACGAADTKDTKEKKEKKTRSPPCLTLRSSVDVYWLFFLAIGYWLLTIGYCLLSVVHCLSTAMSTGNKPVMKKEVQFW